MPNFNFEMITCYLDHEEKNYNYIKIIWIPPQKMAKSKLLQNEEFVFEIVNKVKQKQLA